MVDSEDTVDLACRQARIEQVELAIGRKLVQEGSGGEDAHAAAVGRNLVAAFHAQQLSDQERQIEMWMGGDWEGLLEAGIISGDEFLDLEEHHTDGNPGPNSRRRTSP